MTKPKKDQKKKIKPHDPKQLDAPENKWKIWGENSYLPWYNRFQQSGSNPEDLPPDPPGNE